MPMEVSERWVRARCDLCASMSALYHPEDRAQLDAWLRAHDWHVCGDRVLCGTHANLETRGPSLFQKAEGRTQSADGRRQ